MDSPPPECAEPSTFALQTSEDCECVDEKHQIYFPPSPPPFKCREINESNDIVGEVMEIYHELSQFRDNLAPQPAINQLFTRLVEMCIVPRNDSIVQAVLLNKDIQLITRHLRQLCSQGESELEKHWANKILETNAFCSERGQHAQ